MASSLPLLAMMNEESLESAQAYHHTLTRHREAQRAVAIRKAKGVTPPTPLIRKLWLRKKWMAALRLP